MAGQARVPIKVHYVPSYYRTWIRWRLWGLMHRRVTHNRSHTSYNEFCRCDCISCGGGAESRAVFCNSVTDNFRVINPTFSVLKA